MSDKPTAEQLEEIRGKRDKWIQFEDADKLFAHIAALTQERDALQKQYDGAEFWSNWVYPNGANPSDIQAELADYHEIMDEVSKVYDNVTGGKFSKSNTAAVHIIDAVDQEIIKYCDNVREQMQKKIDALEATVRSVREVVDSLNGSALISSDPSRTEALTQAVTKLRSALVETEQSGAFVPKPGHLTGDFKAEI